MLYNKDKTKANLYATVGPHCEQGIVLSGHTDVVPVDGQNWNSDPFILHREGDRLFGRGTADMKTFLDIVLYMIPSFSEAKLARPIHLAFSYDEEVGCQGVPSLIEYITSNVPKPQMVIVGEPTQMKMIVSHKSINGFKTSVKGFSAHSSAMDKGVNAIVVAANLIAFLQQSLADMSRFKDDRFDLPYTTFNIGKIQGGTALNIFLMNANLNGKCVCCQQWKYKS